MFSLNQVQYFFCLAQRIWSHEILLVTFYTNLGWNHISSLLSLSQFTFSSQLHYQGGQSGAKKVKWCLTWYATGLLLCRSGEPRHIGMEFCVDGSPVLLVHSMTLVHSVLLICHLSLVCSVTLIYPLPLCARSPAFSLCSSSTFCHSPVLHTGCKGAFRGLQHPHRSGLKRDSLEWVAAATGQSSRVFPAPELASLVLRLCTWPSVACGSWYHCWQRSFLLLGPAGIPRVCMPSGWWREEMTLQGQLR